MLVLGVNAATTRSGKRLKDGGLAIILNGKILVAVGEERISRLKHDGGFNAALQRVEEKLGIRESDFDAIVISSCCEAVPKQTQINASYSNNTVYAPSHHLSHAYSTFFSSPFDQALVIVIDAGGNVIGNQTHSQWWRNPREQHSYYLGQGNKIRLIDRDFDKPYDVGLGEAYRAFTYFLGWHSYTFSANTMALAAYGDPDRFGDLKLFRFNNGELTSLMKNHPPNPIEMIEGWAKTIGASIPPPRQPEDSLSQEYKDLALFIQTQLEEALLKKVTYLVNKTGIRNLCIAGGVGLNCVANRRLLDETPIDNIFIQPASGDQGQALGNALYGYQSILLQNRPDNKFSPFLGFEYDLSFESIYKLTSEVLSPNLKISPLSNPARSASELLSKGRIVAWYQGRSEYGPRALGNRSILADPRSGGIRERCHEIKKREFFRPFAPSVIEKQASRFFQIDVPSPHMLLVAKAHQDMGQLIPAVLHVDSSARLQTVSKHDNALYHDLLTEFEKLSGIPMVLNTSFNSRGQPIVETASDALDAFLDLDLDVLIIGNTLIEKRPDTTISIVTDVHDLVEYSWVKFNEKILGQKIHEDFPSYRLVARQVIGLYAEYLDLLHAGAKRTTIRYRRGAIEYPMKEIMSLLNTGTNGGAFHAYPAGRLLIQKLTVKKFCKLDDEDALNDGFQNSDQLKRFLEKTYGPIMSDEPVSIYHVELKEPHE